ncbi:hypothetical protein LWI29_004711 [Acer saccharum]|uniref:TF-B3 domain-containing protein n=1 Tax=Acer saccharum TaxID=4024 RepID=A0AA39T161_ACESA|nr:hypothetical protein LWI29_004711 [Acer saccharum]
MEHMGEHSVEFIALDRWKQRWPLKYYTRPNGDRRIPVITTGWRKFVEANGVIVGDKLIFSRHQDAGEMPYYMIQVKRRTKTIKGKTVDVDVIKTVQGEPVNYLKN